ncbi:ion channel [Rhizobium leguminosarum]|uniref:ion channel n=1 Tax=Rhizobium leguminosarum TaxID=384 RepID=UPI002FF309C7
MTGYAMVFYMTGIEDTAQSGMPVTAFSDYLYYSTVTFTTLGYGDFRPCGPARLYAATEALFGGFFMPFSSAVVFLSKILRDREIANN